MNYTLEESLNYSEKLIEFIKTAEKDNDHEMILKLEATLMCFQFHIKSLGGLK